MFEDTRVLHVEPTSLCNAECPMCARNTYGKGINPNITLGSLTLQWVKSNILPQDVRNLEKIFFCGNLGDPAACPELLDIIHYLKTCKEELVLGLNTNGGLKTTTWWDKLGQLLNGRLDYCVFSIDGLEDTNHLHRRKVVWQKVMENAKAYISTGASAHWDMLVFKHNSHQIDDARKMAKDLGFTWFRSKQTDRWDTYTETNLEPVEKYNKPDIGEITCEKERDSSMFIDHTGRIWPCCHMAEAYFNKIGEELHKDIRQFDNEELLVEYKKRLKDNPFYICGRACGTQGKHSQWKTEEQLR
jgi:MoaA/NifB/PqqE/SkfB family radical SAM enzyme